MTAFPQCGILKVTRELIGTATALESLANKTADCLADINAEMIVCYANSNSAKSLCF